MNLLDRQSELIQRPALIRRNHHISFLNQLLCLSKLRRNMKVQLNAVLASPAIQLKHRLFLMQIILAANHQDIRPCLCKQSGACRSGNDMRQIQHFDSGERSPLRTISAKRLPRRFPCFLKTEQRHGSHCLSDFRILPLPARPEHAPAGTIPERRFLQILGIPLADRIRSKLPVFAKTPEHKLFRLFGNPECFHHDLLLGLIIHMRRKIPMILGLILVKRAIQCVIHPDRRFIPGTDKFPIAFIRTHIKPDYLKSCKRHITIDGVRMLIRIPHFSEVFGHCRIHRKNCCSRSCLQNLFVLKQTPDCFQPQ